MYRWYVDYESSASLRSGGSSSEFRPSRHSKLKSEVACRRGGTSRGERRRQYFDSIHQEDEYRSIFETVKERPRRDVKSLSSCLLARNYCQSHARVTCISDCPLLSLRPRLFPCPSTFCLSFSRTTSFRASLFEPIFATTFHPAVIRKTDPPRAGRRRTVSRSSRV